MSTRSIVRIKSLGREVKLYHHHDGYPEGVGMDLMNRYYERFKKAEASNNTISLMDIANELVKDKDDEYQITVANHCDIEYEYIIDCNNYKIFCYGIGIDWETGEVMFRTYVDLEKLYMDEKEKNKESANA